MGRPSKLSERCWDDIGYRLLNGEKGAKLAREFGVSKVAVSVRFSERNRRIRRVANMLVQAELALRALPPDQQLAALRLAEDLRIRSEVDRLVTRSIMPTLWRW